MSIIRYIDTSMQIRIIQQKNKSGKIRKYAQIVASVRRPDGMPAKKVIAHLGPYDQILHENLKVALKASRGDTLLESKKGERVTFECMENDEITITYEDCAGIAENNQSRNVQIVPNPNNGSFIIRFDLQINEPVDVTVFNPVSGNVFERANVQVDQMNVLDVNLDKVSNGIYFLKISNAEVNILKKIIVRN